MKILAIEEDEFMKIFLKDVFWMHRDGHDEFFVASSVKKAKDILKEMKPKPDLIFLSLQLPDCEGGKCDIETGYGILKELKSSPKTKDIKIIVFSSFGDKEIENKAMKLGADKFLVKGEHLPADIIKISQEIVSKPAAVKRKQLRL